MYPVYVIFFEQQGLDYRQISLLLAVWALAALLSEVPAGVVADAWSRKGVLVVAMVLKAVGFIVWLAYPQTPGFAVGFILWGLQEGFSTGVSEAWLYDALQADGQAERFVELSGRSGLFQRVAVALSVLFGGVVFSFSVAAVMITSAVSMGISGVCAALLPEKRPHRDASFVAAQTLGAIAATVREAARIPRFVPLILFTALGIVTYGIMDEYDFLIGAGYGVPVALIGLWGGARFLLEGLGSAMAHRMHWLNPERNPGMIAAWIAGAGMLLIPVGLLQRVFLVPLYFLFYLLMAAAEVIIQGWIQDRVSSEGRATVASVVSFAYELVGLGLLLLSGIVMQRSGLHGFILAAGITVLVSAVGVFWAFGRSTAPIEGAEEHQDGIDL